MNSGEQINSQLFNEIEPRLKDCITKKLYSDVRYDLSDKLFLFRVFGMFSSLSHSLKQEEL